MSRPDLVTLKRRLLRQAPVRAVRSGVDLVMLLGQLARSPAVDPDLYERQRPDHQAGPLTNNRLAASAHWLTRGAAEGLLLGPTLVPPVSLGPAMGSVGRGEALKLASRLRRVGFPSSIAVGFAGTDPAVLAALADDVVAGRPTPVSDSPSAGGVPLALVVLAATRSLDVEHLPPLARGGSTILVATDPTPMGRLVAAALARRPSFVASPSLAPALDLLTQGPDGDLIVLMAGGVELQAADLDRLLSALGAREDIAAGGPVLLDRNGVVASAGLTPMSGGGSEPLAYGLSPDDVARDRTPRVVPTLAPDLVVMRRGALRLALADIEEHVDSLQQVVSSAALRHALLVPDVAVRKVTVEQAGRHPVAQAPRPAQVSEGPPRLRWAVKSAHPAGAAGLAWGDLHYARALAAALERLGQFAVVDPLDAWNRPSADQDDVTLVLRGLHRYQPTPGPSVQTHVVWVISHPELVSDSELAAADLAYAASLSWSAAARRRGLDVRPLLQCTDSERFTPDAGPASGGPAVLFVGNTRKARRPIVEWAQAAGLPLSVVGAGWAGRLPAEAILADHVDNAALPALYRSAGVVLNDHWPQMAREGFLSNRLFDLAACGARWISDEATDLHAVFGGLARTVPGPAELAAVVHAGPRALPSAEERQQWASLVKAEHSFDARAEQLIRDVTVQRTQVVP